MTKDLTDLPQPDRVDHAISVLRAAVTAVPLVGSSITELLDGFFSSPISKRREEWLRTLAVAIVELKERDPGLTLESLQQDERFISAVLNATAFALRTHRHEKLAALKNGVKSAVVHRDIDEDVQTMFLSYVDVLTPTHLLVLHCFHDPDKHFRRIGKPIEWFHREPGSPMLWSTSRSTHEFMAAAFPELIYDSWQLLSQVIHDLGQRSLIAASGVHSQLPDVGPYTTSTGQRFLRFIGEQG